VAVLKGRIARAVDEEIVPLHWSYVSFGETQRARDLLQGPVVRPRRFPNRVLISPASPDDLSSSADSGQTDEMIPGRQGRGFASGYHTPVPDTIRVGSSPKAAFLGKKDSGRDAGGRLSESYFRGRLLSSTVWEQFLRLDSSVCG